MLARKFLCQAQQIQSNSVYYKFLGRPFLFLQDNNTIMSITNPAIIVRILMNKSRLKNVINPFY